MKLFIRISAFIIAFVFAALLFTSASAADKVVFIKQPTGGITENGTDFTVTFETNVECECMLQSRENERYDWGNYNFVTSPFTIIGELDRSEEFRLTAYGENGEEYHSDIFKVTWKTPDDITEITVNEIDFGTFAYGTDIAPVPLVIRNTGKYTLRSPSIEIGWDDRDYIEVIQNKEPHDIKPGEVDSATWSVRPKPDLGSGDYYCSVYIHAPNLVNASNEGSACRFVITDSGDAEFAIRAQDVDFGSLEAGFTGTYSQPLTVSASGSGNLHNVHLKLNEPGFFRLSCTYIELAEMKAGTTSGNNWEIVLLPGLAAGYYEHVIEVYADELTEPYYVTVRAVVGEVSEADTEPSGQAGETEDGNTAGTDGKTDGGKFPWWIIPVFAVTVAGAVLITVVVMKKKRTA